MASYTATDPRGSDVGDVLDVEFDISSYGSAPNNYGLPEDCDPGESAEITILKAHDEIGADVLSLLTTEQAGKIEDEILENYDFDRSDDDYEDDL